MTTTCIVCRAPIAEPQPSPGGRARYLCKSTECLDRYESYLSGDRKHYWRDWFQSRIGAVDPTCRRSRPRPWVGAAPSWQEVDK